ncbi:hypothetical protein GGI00_006330 [Coemansia sp. RSA 2681]|nr:hypothetical protein GGI00_006330 [Coemansia sp. RSA 2681]
MSKKTKTKIVVSAAASVDNSGVDSSGEQAGVVEDAPSPTDALAAAAPEQDSEAFARITEAVAQLETELNAKLAELDRKYVLEFQVPPIVLSHSTSQELIKQTNDMIKGGELAGRLVKRVSWVDIEFDPLPEPGDFDIGEVMKSPYFFS